MGYFKSKANLITIGPNTYPSTTNPNSNLDHPKVLIVFGSSQVYGVDKLSDIYFKSSSGYIGYQNPKTTKSD